MATEIQSFINTRGQIKGKVTRFQNFLDEWGDNVDPLQVQARLEKLEDHYKQFEEVQGKLEELDPKNVAIISERETFETSYYNALAAAKRVLQKLQTADIKDKPVQTFENTQRAKLPKIELKTFSGDLEDWLSFKNLFTSLIHNVTSLPKVEKLHYLRSVLKNEAAQLIQQLELTDQNYDIAWDLLHKRYHNRKLITQRHIKLLFEQSKLTKEDRVALKELLDTTQKHVRALQALNHPVESWDALLIHVVTSKLDSTTLRAWEIHCDAEELPKFDEFCKFIQHRCNMLESLHSKQDQGRQIEANRGKPSRSHVDQRKYSTTFHSTNRQQLQCSMCKGSHQLFQCEKFKNLTPKQRFDHVKQFKICINCLVGKHSLKYCKASNCRNCHKRHNTLLHFDITQTSQQHEQPVLGKTNDSNTSSTPSNFVGANTNVHKQVLLSTALVEVKNNLGNYSVCRVLLDNASHSNFITETCCKKLGLQPDRDPIMVSGINNAVTQVNNIVTLKVRDINTHFCEFEATCLLINNITEQLPLNKCALDWTPPRNIYLADPYFYEPAGIDILLGAQLFWELLGERIIKFPNGISLRETNLGYIVTGSVPSSKKQSQSVTQLNLTQRVDEQLKKFWSIENLPNHSLLSPEQEECELHFRNTVTRNEEGRYIVSMLQNSKRTELGNSKFQAMKRFLHLENKLQRDSNLRQQYETFMKEYEMLSHMQTTENEEINSHESFFLPHHAVMKPESTSTKVRVVFDGSMKSDTGISLNDTLCVGPVVQSDIFSIHTRFRMHKFVLTGDIEKMYRQILINPDQTNLQKILWRTDPSKPIQIFKLKTITYGLSCSPYLATRTLLQLTQDVKNDYPLASSVIKCNTYVDDLLCGAETEEEIMKLKLEISRALQSGCFNMRKWCSNSAKVMHQVPAVERVTETMFDFNKHETVKTLGTLWNPHSDTFHFSVNLSGGQRCTKRIILSEIARIYDVLGLLGPAVVHAKMFMQNLWKMNLQWDQQVPEHMATMWMDLCKELNQVSYLKIPRGVISITQIETFQYHVFCDASESAYGACVYVRTVNQSQQVSVHLLASKSKVAPIKQISIPRLELCGALLATELLTKVRNALEGTTASTTFWTDSQIVLAWLARNPSSWKVFIANRVAKIQEVSDMNMWRYVRSKDNPADIISRGDTHRMIQNPLWFEGPVWLKENSDKWPCKMEKVVVDTDLLETKQTSTLVSISNASEIWNRFSSFSKLIRVIAFCLRFVVHCKGQKENRQNMELSCEELDRATITVIKQIQAETYNVELRDLKNHNKVSHKSKLLSLNPYIDHFGILRVGGRIDKAHLSLEERHPIILPPKHTVTRLIIKQEHFRHLHVGPQALLYNLRLKYWIVNAKREINSVLRNCIVCFKVKPKQSTQLMGQLPEARLIPHRPFSITGVDYAGPVYLKQSVRRNAALVKAYIVLFICFATKAIHLELATKLTTDAFISTLQRFVSRRGICKHLYSDNAKTFLGAKRELEEFVSLHTSKEFKERTLKFLSSQGISWHFTTPYAPHTGGLWEGNIRMMKYHLKRVVGNSYLTYEQFSTVLTQIEAILNSRPLCPMSTDVNDLMPLTPGHSLIGQPLTAIPQPLYTEINTNRLSNYEYLQHLVQNFWSRWKKEYLLQLQQRNKWKFQSRNFEVGQLVLLKNVTSYSMVWNLGRIVDIYHGSDGLVRTVKVKTKHGEFKRPITQVCLLPDEDK